MAKLLPFLVSKLASADFQTVRLIVPQAPQIQIGPRFFPYKAPPG